MIVVVVVANNQTEESCTREQQWGFVLAQILVQPWKELTNEWWGGRQQLSSQSQEKFFNIPPALFCNREECKITLI